MSTAAPRAATPHDAALQADIAAKHRALEKNIAGYLPADAAKSVAQALRYFEDNSRADREQLLKSGQMKSRVEQATCTWLSERYDHLLRLARDTVLRTFSQGTQDAAARAPVSALAILLSGHAIKWRKFAGARPDATAREWLHQIFRTAAAFGQDGAVLPVRIEDRQVEATVEALYVRALLLDRFTSGNLPPTRLEILDNWLTAWMGALWLTREAAAGEPTLGVNTGDPLRGFTPHAPGDGAEFFLSLKPLKRQLDRTIRDFHLGSIFPGWGVGMQAAMEDHVAVIEFLEREFTLIEGARTQRSKRMAIAANSIVGVFFGFDEICKLAFSPDRLHSLTGGGGDLGIRNAIHLLDISEGGLGLEMAEEDARKVSVDDLLAVRIEKGRPCVLGVVVRKSGLTRPSAVLVGVKLLTKSPVHRSMDYVDAGNTWQATVGLLAAGAAADGFGDSVIVSDKVYHANALLAVTLGPQTFELHLRRVRQQGPGWRMAAYDAVEAPA